MNPPSLTADEENQIEAESALATLYNKWLSNGNCDPFLPLDCIHFGVYVGGGKQGWFSGFQGWSRCAEWMGLELAEWAGSCSVRFLVMENCERRVGGKEDR
jgi:hypothetical protein